MGLILEAKCEAAAAVDALICGRLVHGAASQADCYHSAIKFAVPIKFLLIVTSYLYTCMYRSFDYKLISRPSPIPEKLVQVHFPAEDCAVRIHTCYVKALFKYVSSKPMRTHNV
jgi:hypothetical protein